MEKQLYANLHQLLNEENFDEAIKLIDETLKTVSFETTTETLFFKFKLYGFLIDIGCESQNEDALNEAIKFYESNHEEFFTCITKSSYYYNLANAKHGLERIFWSKNRGVHSIKITKNIFQEPIKLYWLAYKSITDKDKSLLTQILINLSNSLVDTSRIVEAIQFLDIVLKEQPNYPQALISRGDHLHQLSIFTNCSPTIALYTQIFKSYDAGIKIKALPQSILNRCIYQKQEVLNTIQSHGFDVNNIEQEIQESQKEFNNHSTFRKFCITNFLTLNEHGIYCNCIATEKDDLQIGVKHALFKGDLVPQLELLLNRMKSEFALSRWLYYQAIHAEIQVENDTKFTELLDGEIINSYSEMLRTSFRLCYGILDKIALGICKLYELDSNRIHFETFWEDKKRSEKLNQVRNIHLNAIYSIACDLNTTTGELKQFKTWRNDLEHNLLVLRDTTKPDFDILKLYSDKNFVTVVDANDFANKTLHLLQLTRAAIFSYVFCVRLQTINHYDESLANKSFKIDFKE